MNKKDFDWKKYLKECLDSTTFCCIATVDPKGVWANPVYFAYDEKFNFYFISQMRSRHMQNLKKDPRISVSVYKTEQKGDVVGTYIEGEAKIILKDQEEIKKAFDTRFFDEERKEVPQEIFWLVKLQNVTWPLQIM